MSDLPLRSESVHYEPVHFELVSSSFCGACRQTRMALTRVLQLVPGSTLTEFDVAGDPGRAASLNIEHTPTTIIRDSHGREVTRAVGVPSLPQILVAAARARDAVAASSDSTDRRSQP